MSQSDCAARWARVRPGYCGENTENDPEGWPPEPQDRIPPEDLKGAIAAAMQTLAEGDKELQENAGFGERAR